MNELLYNITMPEEIAEYLVKVTNGSEEVKEGIIEVLYRLKCDAENKYNIDGYRQLYKALSILASSEVELLATCFEVDDNLNIKKDSSRHYTYVKGTTPEEVFAGYLDECTNHNCVKFSPLQVHDIRTIRSEAWNDGIDDETPFY